MKKTAILAALALSATVWSSSAQDQGGQRPERPGAPRPEGGQQGQRPEGQRPQGGPGGQGQGQGGFRPMPNPIVTALDANSDGTIDESELKNATAALKKLDKDGDGKLSQEETRPAGMGGRGSFGGGQGGPGQGGPGGPGGQGGGGGDFVATFMQNDKNGDGKIAKDEVSERAQGMFGRLDTNSDGFIDKKELEIMAAQMRERGAGGQGGQRPPGEGGARPEGGNRPQRPPTE
jgi:hypothetical protein